MDTERCKKLVATIQQLEKTEVEELFKMLHVNGCRYTTNNHGVFMNLSWLTDDILQKIETYVAFCVRSKSEVQRYESLCDVLNKNIQAQPKHAMLKSGQDALSATPNNSAVIQEKKTTASRVSSSMKFYLLKKRFAKHNVVGNSLRNDLAVESYDT